jgi:hypothetical protein
MKRGLVLGALVLAACTEPAAPARSSTYAFDVGGDVFHWPGDRLPVRYYADARGNMAFLIGRALGIWEDQFLYGEFRGVVVSDSTNADVIVRWADSVPPDVPPDAGPPVAACDGVTTLFFDSAGTALAQPVRAQIRITTGQAFTAAQVAACLRRVTIHELGHTLGILQESPGPTDIMNTAAPVSLPSGRDRQTVEVLYHTPPTIGPPPR